jgi:hypothetical protein
VYITLKFLASNDAESYEKLSDDGQEVTDRVLALLEQYPSLNESVKLSDPLTEEELMSKVFLSVNRPVYSKLFFKRLDYKRVK